MTRRNSNTPNLADLEGANEPIDTPPMMPPPGTPAKARTIFDWQANIDPNQVPGQARYSDELRELAASEFAAMPELPLDPLSAFCEQWHDYAGCSLIVTRHPDPVHKRPAGRQYNIPSFEIENIGSMPFDPINIVSDLQAFNGNSGGVFRLFLRDYNNQRIASLDRVVIPDPPNERLNASRRRDNDYDNEHSRYREPVSAPAPSPKSDDEIMLANAKNQLFTTALARALEPPKPAEPVNPLTQLSAEDQLAFGLLKQGNTLQTVIEKIATITNQPDRIDPAPTWKDKGMDAAIQLVTQNPAIIAQVTDIATRALTALVTAFAPRASQVINEPLPAHIQTVQHRPPAQRTTPVLQPALQSAPVSPQAVSGLPETNQPEDDPFDDDDPELIMLEEITKLLLSTKPLSLSDPVILDLQTEYPQQFATALGAIAAMPSGFVINYICRKSEFAADMFESHGPHLQKRLEELKALIKLPPETQAEIQDALAAAATLDNNATAESEPKT